LLGKENKMTIINRFIKRNKLLLFLFFVLLLVSPIYKGSANNKNIVKDQSTQPTETNYSLNALPFPDSRLIRVAIYAQPNATNPSYTGVLSAGMSTNNVSQVETILLAESRIQATVIFDNDIINHYLTTANFDVLLIPDAHPRESVLNLIHEFWLGGGGILALDGAALFLNYLGILPPEAVGTDGYGVYWNYDALGFNFTIRHPTTQWYAVDAFIELPAGYNYFGWDWSALSGSSIASDLIPLAHDFDDANIITALAMDRHNIGGKVVTISNDLTNRYSTEIDQLIIDSLDWLTPRPKGKILVDMSHNPYYGVDPWDDMANFAGKYETFRNRLVARDFTIDKLYEDISGENITLEKLAPYDMLIVITPQIGNAYSVSEINDIETWVADGGSLFVAGENPNALSTEVAYINELIAPYDLAINDGNFATTSFTDYIAHPTTEECSGGIELVSYGYINITGSAFGIWYDSTFSNIVAAGNEYGNGRVILIADINWFDDTYIPDDDNIFYATNVANWLTAATANVLVYGDWIGAPNPYVQPVTLALNDLGIKYHFTREFFYLNLSLHAKPWDFVIITNPSNTGLNLYFDDIIDYIDSGGHLLLSTYIMDDYSTDPIWAKLGTAFNTDYTSNPDLYIWDTGHQIFTQPHLYSESKFVIGTPYTDDGDTVTVFSNATALAGFTASETADESFITLRNDEQTLFNSFLIDEFTNDYDDSTYADNFELWKNEIAFMMRPKLDFLIYVPLEAYANVGVSFTANITNVGLSICPIGYLELTLTPGLSTLDDLEQSYVVEKGETVILAWAVSSNQIQNTTVSFEGIYTGFLGTEFGTGVLNFDIHFTERPVVNLPWYYYVAVGGGLLLIILIIVIATRVSKKKKNVPTR